MRALVTGANGFVGSALLQAAAGAAIEATGVTRRDTDYSPRSIATLVNELRVDFVFHGAGAASVAASMQDPGTDFASSVALFERMLEGVRLSSRRPRVIFPSSAAVYGNAERQPIAEDARAAPISAYGHHKLICEQLAAEYAACFDVPGMVIRVFSLFGAAQRRLLVWELYRQHSEAGEVTLKGTGEEERDYLHIDDFAALVWRSARSIEEKMLTVNVASGLSLRARDLAVSVGRAMASGKRVSCLGQPTKGDPGVWRADIARLQSIVGTVALPDFETRLRQVIADWSR